MMVSALDQTATDYEAIATDIAAWLEQHRAAAGADRYVLGLSGGVDSAVVCGLCVRAAGADRVTGVIMPSHSNPDDARYAADVAAAFNVETITVELTEVAANLVGAIDAGIAASGVSPETTEQRQILALANVRPRLRMTTLYFLSNLRNGIVVGTGNKSEAKIGYFTKYGDGGVDLFPIIDLYKFEVRALARVLAVPEAVIIKPPSAGLWPGQTDEGEIGLLYDELDAALIAIDEGREASIEPNVRERVLGMMRASDHKRQPVPAYQRPSKPARV